MAGKDYTELAIQLIEKVGGKENIVSVMNCMTRIRFTLKDESVVDDEEVKKIEGVMGVIRAGGQYQCVIGTHVPEVLACVTKITGIDEAGSHNAIQKAVEDSKEKKKTKGDNKFNEIMKAIAGCIMPSIGVLAGGGILQGILAALVSFGVLTKGTNTHMVLYAAANAYLYFMPVIVGFAAGKVFGMNQYLSATLGAALIYPTLVEAMNAGTAISFIGIPVSLEKYATTFLPIVLEIYVASKLEKLLKKILPQVMHLMIIPLVVLAVMVPVTFLAIGPVMNALANVISDAMMAAYGFSPVLMGVILGAFWQVIVMLGLLRGISAILINDITVNGFTSIGAVMGLTVWSVAGVGLGYALKVKNKEKKYTALGAFVSSMCGITEPVLYTICLPSMKHFICSFIGGGAAGGIAAAMGMKLYTFGGDGIFKFPGMINPEGLDSNIWIFCVTALIAIGVSAITSYIVTDADEE